MPVYVTRYLYYPAGHNSIKVKLPTEKSWGIPASNDLFFRAEPADPKMASDYKDYPTVEAKPDVPPIVIYCPFCDGEKRFAWMQKLGDRIYCWSSHRTVELNASRFCLEALARLVWEAAGMEYDYGSWFYKKETEDWKTEKAAEFLEKWVKALEDMPPPPKISVGINFGEDGFITYPVTTTRTEKEKEK